MAEAETVTAQLLQQLQAAHQWLNILVDQFDLEPAETAINVSAASAAVEARPLARVTLEHSLSQIAAAIEAGKKAAGGEDA